MFNNKTKNNTNVPDENNPNYDVLYNINEHVDMKGLEEAKNFPKNNLNLKEFIEFLSSLPYDENTTISFTHTTLETGETFTLPFRCVYTGENALKDNQIDIDVEILDDLNEYYNEIHMENLKDALQDFIMNYTIKKEID